MARRLGQHDLDRLRHVGHTLRRPSRQRLRGSLQKMNGVAPSPPWPNCYGVQAGGWDKAGRALASASAVSIVEPARCAWLNPCGHEVF